MPTCICELYFVYDQTKMKTSQKIPANFTNSRNLEIMFKLTLDPNELSSYQVLNIFLLKLSKKLTLLKDFLDIFNPKYKDTYVYQNYRSTQNLQTKMRVTRIQLLNGKDKVVIKHI